MSVFKLDVKKLESFSIKNLGVRHKVQIFFGLTSLVPLAVFSYVLLRENVFLGTQHWFLMSLAVLLALFGLELTHATFEEVSDRSKMDRRLIQSEEKYSLLLHHSYDAIFLHNLKGEIIDVNRKGLDLLGYTKAEIMTRNISDLHPHEAHEKLRWAFEAIMEDNSVNFEIEFRKKSGEVFAGEVSSNLVEMGGEKIIQGIVRDIDERERAKEALQESQERYRALFDRTLLCIYIHDFEGKFLDANEAALNLVGYTKEEIPTVTIATLLDEEQLPIAFQSMEEIKERGFEKKPHEYKLKRKNGEHVWVETESSVIYRNGKPYALQGIARDITERKRTEEALSEAEERFRTLFEDTVIGLYRTTPDGKILMANPALVRMLGYDSLEELKQRNLEKKGFEPEYRRSVFKKRIEEEGQVAGLESSWIRSDGTTIYVRESARCTRGEAGNVLFYEGTVEDISERKQAEDALRLEKAYLEQLFETAPEAIVMADNNGRIQRINSEFAKLFGYGRNEAVGRSLDELVSTEDLRDEARSITEKVAKGEKVSHETLRRRKDGTLFNVSILASPIIVDDEQVGVYGIYRDISERVQAEKALRTSEERYRSFVHNFQGIAFRSHINWTPVFFHGAVEEITGFREDDFIRGEPRWDQIIHKDDLKVLLEKYPPEIFTDQNFSPEREYRIVRKDGEIRWVHDSLHAILDEAGNPLFLQGALYDITERKRSEEALKENQEKYSNLFQYSNDAIFLHDLVGTVIDVNQKVLDLFGYTKDEILSLKIPTLHPSHALEQFKQAFESISEDGFVDFEIDFQKKDGEIFPAEVSSSLLEISGKKVIQAIVRDITDRRRAKEALQREKAFLEQLFESAQEAIVMADNNGKTMRLNSEFGRLFGYECDEAIGRSVDELIAPKNLRDEAMTITEKVTHGEKVAVESLRQRKDGTLINVSVLASPIIVGDEQVALYGIYRDITDRKHAEEALRESEEKYRNLIDQSRDAIYLLFNGKFEIINKRFEELFGYNQEETNSPDFNFMNLVSLKSRNLIEERVKKVQEGESVSPQYEFTAVSREGKEIEVETSVSYIQYKGGIATQGVLRDITERVRAEKALREYATELERSNTELEHFAYIASHDLQEPLRMVASYLQLLERRYKDKLDSDANEFIAYAVDGAVRMQTLINDLLVYSRVGTRGKPFERTECEHVFDQALTNLKVTVEENNAVVTHDALPTVMADMTQLVQVFQNLIGNAIKFRTEQRPEIHVGAVSREGEWVFSVRDNGIGLDPQYAERVFRIFQRLHTREEYPGTGAGLAICKKIVERHGGQIWVESKPGEGSQFFFTLPAKGDASV